MTFRFPFSLPAKTRKLILGHIGVWTIFISYEVAFIYLSGGKPGKLVNYVSAYLTNALLFYANIWSLNYSFTDTRKKYLYIFLLLAELVVYFAIKFLLAVWLIDWNTSVVAMKMVSYYVFGLYRGLYFLGFSFGYWSVQLLLRSNNLVNKMESRHLIQQRRSAELERNLFKAKNAYLTSQINPHLLFNTLNFIYSNLYDVSQKAADTVMLLSDMMRYSLTEIGDDGQVELSREVEHIENMIELNQARFDDKLQIKLYLNGEFDGIKIIPLVLLTFIENIFKHGDLKDPNLPAKVNISYYHNILEFYSTNKVRKVNISKGDSIGIENSKTRLDVAYPKRYKLTTQTEGDQFITKLTIQFYN